MKYFYRSSHNYCWRFSMRSAIRSCCFFLLLGGLVALVVFQNVAATWKPLLTFPAASNFVPLQATEDIAGFYGGSARGSSPDCDVLNPINEAVNIQLDPPTGSRVTGLASVGALSTGSLSATISPPG